MQVIDWIFLMLETLMLGMLFKTLFKMGLDSGYSIMRSLSVALIIVFTAIVSLLIGTAWFVYLGKMGGLS